MAATISYPYPVLGNADDISEGTISPDVSFRVSDETVAVDVTRLTTSNALLDSLIDAGSALWAIRVQCARTYYRKEFVTSGPTKILTFPGDDLQGRVDIEISLFAAKPLPAYAPPGVHSDYGTTAFGLERGEVLGIGPAFSFEVDKQFDPLRAPVSSIMRIRQGDHAEGTYRLVLEDDFIEVLLSQHTWARYAGVRDRVPAVLHIGLVMPALVEGLRRLNDFSGRRWADRLRAIVETKGVDTSTPIEAAQILLQDPLGRAFDELNLYLDRDSS
jgi:hypothetical protein